ncbi:MAG: radical SAM protein [Gammaproteobacteria bacterium]|nr:MAG: radical SAM protein [Gammaproteobacteria bacterium]
MHYEGNIIRPPSEADSIILQITKGCSHGRCSFCGAYGDKRFALKDLEIIKKDIAFAAHHMTDKRRAFLCDGDALVTPFNRLVQILEWIKEYLPQVNRISTYANCRSISMKSDDELKQLKELGLTTFYTGLESGSDSILQRINKGFSSADIIRESQRIKSLGIKSSVTVLLGIAGKEQSEKHAIATGKVITQMEPEQTAALSLMLVAGTPMAKERNAGRFIMPDKNELLRELYLMVDNINCKTLFLSNHASNYLAIKARLPKNKEKVKSEIEAAIRGDITLRPEWMRGL